MTDYDLVRNSGSSGLLPAFGTPGGYIIAARVDLAQANSGDLTSGDAIFAAELPLFGTVTAAGMRPVEGSTSAVLLEVKVGASTYGKDTVSASSVGNQDHSASAAPHSIASGDKLTLSVSTSVNATEAEVIVWAHVIPTPVFPKKKPVNPSS